MKNKSAQINRSTKYVISNTYYTHLKVKHNSANFLFWPTETSDAINHARDTGIFSSVNEAAFTPNIIQHHISKVSL